MNGVTWCHPVSWNTVAKTAKGLGLFAKSTSISMLWLSSGPFSGIALLLSHGIRAKQGQQRCKGLRAGVWLALHTHKRHTFLTFIWILKPVSEESPQPALCSHPPQTLRGPDIAGDPQVLLPPLLAREAE